MRLRRQESEPGESTRGGMLAKMIAIAISIAASMSVAYFGIFYFAVHDGLASVPKEWSGRLLNKTQNDVIEMLGVPEATFSVKGFSGYKLSRWWGDVTLYIFFDDNGLGKIDENSNVKCYTITFVPRNYDINIFYKSLNISYMCV